MFNYPLFKLSFNKEELEASSSVVESGWISPGTYTEKLEDLFSKDFLDNRECITTSSCTTAIYLSLQLAGIKKGDEVIISGVNFISVVNCILHMGAIPILADIKNPYEPNVCFENIESKFNKRTRAVVVVHFGGYVCFDFEKIHKLCVDNNVVLIEDVAHAPLAKSQNQTIAGSLGDFSCYSFFSNKNISAGEGGILSVAKDSKYTKSFLKSIKSHGMSILTQDRYKKSISGYDVHEVGFNFRMHEIACSLAYVQAKKYIKHGIQKRKKIISQYRDLLQGSKLRLIFDSESDNYASPHIAVCILPQGHNRDYIMQELAKFGIQTSMHYPNIRDFSLMSEYRDLINTPNCNEYSEYCITIPLYEDLEYDDLRYIVKKLTYLVG